MNHNLKAGIYGEARNKTRPMLTLVSAILVADGLWLASVTIWPTSPLAIPGDHVSILRWPIVVSCFIGAVYFMVKSRILNQEKNEK